MKMVLTHAYYLQNDLKEQMIMKPYPPLGLLYISAWLDKYGMNNDVYDSTFSTSKDQQNYLVKSQPNIIAIYTNLITKLEVAKLIRFIKDQKNFSHSLVVLGGPDVTYNIKEYLDLGADLLVLGEGEQTMLEIAQAHKHNVTSFEHINGLAFKNEEGEIIKTNVRKKINDMDELPLPNRSKIDLQQYMTVWKKHHGKSTLSISTQRGCPYTCKWCSTAVYGQSYRRRSPKKVVDEIEDIILHYHPDHLWFVDDVFTISHKWLQEFADELTTRKVKIPFECITRADRMNVEVIDTLKTAGCFRIWIGAESGSQKILDAMDRRVDILQVQQMIIASNKAGIETGTFIMVGYPGETEEDIFMTLTHLKTANPDWFTITVAYPIKGTSLFEITEDSQTKKEWTKSTDRDIDFKRQYPRKYYNYAVRWLVNNMRLHKLMRKNEWAILDTLPIRIKILVSRIAMTFFKLTSGLV